MLPLVIGAGTLAGNLWAQKKATDAQNDYNDVLQQSLKEQEKVNQGRKLDLEQTFNKNYYQNYLDTETAKALQKRFANFSKEAMDSIRGQSVSGGATPEAVVAQQKTLGDQYNDLLGNIASKYTDYKTNLENQRNMQKLGLWGMDDALAARRSATNAQLAANRIQSADNLAGNITNAGAGVLNAWAAGAFTGI